MQEMNANCIFQQLVSVIYITSSRLSPKIFAIFITITDIHRSLMILLYSQNYEDQVVCGFIVNTRTLSLFFVCLLSHTLRAQVISHQFRVMGMRRCNTFKFFREKHCCCKNIHANIVIVNMSFCQTKYFFLDKNI